MRKAITALILACALFVSSSAVAGEVTCDNVQTKLSEAKATLSLWANFCFEAPDTYNTLCARQLAYWVREVYALERKEAECFYDNLCLAFRWRC